MKYNYIILAMTAFTLSSCTGDKVGTPENEGEAITIRAYQEGATETRTTLIDGGTQVYWEPSDEIKVFFRGSGSRFLSQNTSNADVAEFSGTMNVVVGINEGASGSNTLWGLYPYRADATSDGESVTTILPAEQTGRAGSFAKNTHITLAQSSSFDLAFYNVTGGIRFSLTQEGVKEVVFQGQNDEDIAGKVKIAFVDGVPAIQEVIEGQKTITLTAPNGGTFETGKWYYIVTLPGTLSGGFKITFNTDTQYASLKSSGSKTIKRGVFGSLADADEDLIYKDKEGGDEPATGNIVFADPAAKYACVAKFDTDGDGEVSIEEAEAATSFDGLFNDWKGVTSFDEIRYFKNVHSLSGVFDGCNKLVSITIPETVTDLGTFAFKDCSSLTSVVLPSGITAIGNYTFENCFSLMSIDLPSGITIIGIGSFYKCTSLVSIDIPSNVTTIGGSAFSMCSSLTSVNLPSGVTSIGSFAFYKCTSLVSIDIPSAVRSIGFEAFSGCSSLAFMDLPLQLETIGEYAFDGCSKLTIVNIPSGVSSIPEGCFRDCTSLSSVNVSAGVTTVSNYAFGGVKMWKLELPSSVSSLGSNCFGSIICIILPSTSPVTIQSDTFDGVTAIFVPSNLIGMYGAMTNWANYASKLHPVDTYREKSEYTLATSGAVDMGTSVKWAAYNVGATKPEEYGDYYAWGETLTKSDYSWSTYFDNPSGDGQSFTKYFNGEGGKIVLDPEDDVAHVKWGDKWRMPTAEEWTALREGCYWEWATYQGINGYEIYGFGDGSIIFLPTAGRWEGTSLRLAGSYGDYQSSSLDVSNSNRAWNVYFGSSYFSRNCGHRYYGLSVRPVSD